MLHINIADLSAAKVDPFRGNGLLIARLKSPVKRRHEQPERETGNTARHHIRSAYEHCCVSVIRHAEIRSQFNVLGGTAMARSYATTKDRRKLSSDLKNARRLGSSLFAVQTALPLR